MSKRKFAAISDDYLASLKLEQYNKLTIKKDEYAMRLLKDFASTQSIADVNKLSNTELDFLLQRFYPALRTKSNELFTKNSQDAVRYSLNRGFKKIREDIDIVKGVEFRRSSEIYTANLMLLKREGKNITKHFDAIDEIDVKKIMTTLSPAVPQQLQWIVWFILQVFFCRRGIENGLEMKITDYEVLTVNGRRCLAPAKDEITKNHGYLESSATIKGRIYEVDDDRCPLKLFLKYISSLNSQCVFLWQTPKNDIKPNDTISFLPKKMSVKSYANIMKNISQFCQLEKQYTNHCCRVTSCSLLGQKFSDIEVKEISGHKSLSSLAIYKRVNEKKKAEMSDFISTNICLNTPSTSYDSANTNNLTQNVIDTEPTFTEKMPDCLNTQSKSSGSTKCFKTQLTLNEVRNLLADDDSFVNETIQQWDDQIFIFKPIFNNCQSVSINIPK